MSSIFTCSTVSILSVSRDFRPLFFHDSNPGPCQTFLKQFCGLFWFCWDIQSQSSGRSEYPLFMLKISSPWLPLLKSNQRPAKLSLQTLRCVFWHHGVMHTTEIDYEVSCTLHTTEIDYEVSCTPQRLTMRMSCTIAHV